MKKIVFIGEWYSNNMGEPLLFCCHEKILQDISTESISIKYLDFFGRKSRTIVDTNHLINTAREQNIPLKKKILRKIYFSLPVKVQERIIYSIGEKIHFYKRKTELSKYLIENLADTNGVIIIGAGTLKYDVRLDFGPYYQLITKTCKDLGIPCIVSAVGVESFYENKDYRCRRFSKVLSDDIIKCVTTRDNIKELKLYIRNSKTEIYKIPDPGIWSSECFAIKKNTESSKIGIGIINYKRFIEFNKGITKDQYEKAIIDLIEVLESKGIEWEFFNNGSGEDARFATYLLDKVKKGSKTMIKTPESPEDLVKIISGYKGIVTSRLHSCIVAYSLDIPYIAICWNNKLKYFSQFIGVPERVVETDRLNSKFLEYSLKHAIEQGYDNEKRLLYLRDVQSIMKNYLKHIQ